MSQQAVTLMILVIYLGVVTGWMINERRQHTRNLRSIPTRILVNGIRGKSSITRLIAGALRADPTRTTIAKTTGTAARMIFADGSEEPVVRKHPVVNVIEQVSVIRRAADLHADTLVIECMAVDPGLQELNLQVLTCPDITVLSNVRADHLEEMGGPERSLDQVARSLAGGSMPAGGICVTAECDRWHILQREADRRGTQLVYADPQTVTDAEMAGFGWITFKENVALALEVSRLCGMPREQALAGMYAARPDPGVLRADLCRHNGTAFTLANLFAANDPTSTLANLDLLRERGKVTAGVSVVINCRPDRQERNGQMGQITAQIDPEQIFLIGTPTRSAAEHVPVQLRDRIVDLGSGRTGEQLLDAIVSHLVSDPGHALVLIGNIHGDGETLLDALEATYVPDLDTELRDLMSDSPTVALRRIR